MYHKHNTEGIVVRGYDRGDSSKTILIFSKEFGVIYATAQNARSLNSKLRYSIQDYTLGNFVLVRGKNSWKLVGAESSQNLWPQPTFAKILHTVSHLVGEEKNEELYQIVKEHLTYNNEHLTLLKILKNLGYVEETGEEILELAKNSKRATTVINNGFKEANIV